MAVKIEPMQLPTSALWSVRPLTHLIFLEREHIILVALLAEMAVERVHLADVADVALNCRREL